VEGGTQRALLPIAIRDTLISFSAAPIRSSDSKNISLDQFVVDSKSAVQMAIPSKFKQLMDTVEASAVIPDYVWLSYAICVTEESSCAWEGWILEAAFRETGVDPHISPAAHLEALVRSNTSQACPHCGKSLFRAGLEKRFIIDPSPPKKIPYEYDVVPIEYI
jgi:hypothetical protein